MQTLGKLTSVMLVAVVGVSVTVFIRSIPDLKRYLKIRSM